MGLHGGGDDLSEGLHPLPPLALLLTHEEELAVRSLHCQATLPLVAPGARSGTLPHRVPVLVCAEKHHAELLSVLRRPTQGTDLGKVI